jgi:hypothetical protein
MKKIILYSVLLLSSLTACKKDADIFIPDAIQPINQDTTWVNAITATMPVQALRNAIQIPYVSDSIAFTSGSITTLNAGSGLKFAFNQSSFVDTNGTPINTGSIKVNSLLIKKKGDMIRANMPSSNNTVLLATEGLVYAQFSTNGNNVSFRQGGAAMISFADSTPQQPIQLYFNNNTNTAGFPNWIANTDSVYNIASYTNLNYQWYSNKMGWANVNTLVQSSSNTVAIQVILPTNFTNANTTAYLVYNSFNAVMPMEGKRSLKKFVSSNIPTGQTVKLIVLSKQGNDYYIGSENYTITGNANGILSVYINPTLSNLSGVLQLLQTL